MRNAPGRPPGPTGETRDKILRAAIGLLVDEGPSALTPVRLHRETGVARTTVYRHWPTPRQIVEDVLLQFTACPAPTDRTGDLDRDLGAAIDALRDRFRRPLDGAFFRATLAHGDPTESPTLSERYIAGLIQPVRQVVARVVAQGHLPGATVDELTSALCGPLLLDHLLLGRPVDHVDVEARVDLFLRGRRRANTADAASTEAVANRRETGQAEASGAEQRQVAH